MNRPTKEIRYKRQNYRARRSHCDPLDQGFVPTVFLIEKVEKTCIYR